MASFLAFRVGTLRVGSTSTRKQHQDFGKRGPPKLSMSVSWMSAHSPVAYSMRPRRMSLSRNLESASNDDSHALTGLQLNNVDAEFTRFGVSARNPVCQGLGIYSKKGAPRNLPQKAVLKKLQLQGSRKWATHPTERFVIF